MYSSHSSCAGLNAEIAPWSPTADGGAAASAGGAGPAPCSAAGEVIDRLGRSRRQL